MNKHNYIPMRFYSDLGCWNMSIISVFGKQRQEDWELQAGLAYMGNPMYIKMHAQIQTLSKICQTSILYIEGKELHSWSNFYWIFKCKDVMVFRWNALHRSTVWNVCSPLASTAILSGCESFRRRLCSLVPDSNSFSNSWWIVIWESPSHIPTAMNPLFPPQYNGQKPSEIMRQNRSFWPPFFLPYFCHSHKTITNTVGMLTSQWKQPREKNAQVAVQTMLSWSCGNSEKHDLRGAEINRKPP